MCLRIRCYLAIVNLSAVFPLYVFQLLFLLLLSAGLWGQGNNPFELTDRLEVADSVAPETAVSTGNPFDIVGGEVLTSRQLAERTTVSTASRRQANGPLVIQPVDPNEGQGSLLAIHLILLFSLAGIWLLFGDTLRECLRGTLNDGLLNQVYTRRSGGALTALWVSYVFFFFAAGFYLYLLARNYDISTGQGIWGGWLTFSLVVAAGLGLKSMVLTLYSGLFPVRKEVSRYLFALMVFAILAGLIIAPVNLLTSYAPESYRWTFLHSGILVLGGIYLLHLLRGVFIANKLVSTRPVHILLYICVVEIAPILLIYRYLSDALV